MKKINQKELQAYRKSHEREIFCTKSATYDIVVAQFLLEKNTRASETVDVEQLSADLGFDQLPVKEEDGYSFFQASPSSSKVAIDNEHYQKELDLSKPLIFANGMLIDGHHRLYRAFMLGVQTLAGQTLTAAEARMC